MRPGYFLLTCFVCACALAQESPPPDPKQNQKIERIHVEDSGVKIDEVRYAGQTQSITVQPKDGLPAYEIQPATPSRQRVDDGRKPVGGERVWNVLNF
jgi:hypothetical protein